MPLLPSAAAIHAASAMKHRALVEFQPIDVVLANGAKVRGSGSRAELTQDWVEGGGKTIETLTISLGKDVCPVAPAIHAAITVNGLRYTVRSTSGNTANEAAWRVQLMRTVLPSEV